MRSLHRLPFPSTAAGAPPWFFGRRGGGNPPQFYAAQMLSIWKLGFFKS
jgi:hypothetical protein